MRCFFWLRGGVLLALLSFAAILMSGSAADAGSVNGPASASACSAKLHGWQPVIEPLYVGNDGSNFIWQSVREAAGGNISGATLYHAANGLYYPGTFTGTIEAGVIQVQGSSQEAGWSFSFTGTTTCLLSRLSTTSLVTSPPGELPATFQLTSGCDYPAGPASASPACVARQILDGIPQPLWDKGKAIPGNGRVPYSWGGGHPPQTGPPGPSLGTCKGYTGPHHQSLKACENYQLGPMHTVGLDCSGFTRWVYYLAALKDVLGPGSAATQVRQPDVHPDTGATPSIGDLVFYKLGHDNHIGILIAPGYIIDDPETLESLRVDQARAAGTPHYYKYDFPAPF
jgi:hypothetical protein